MTSANYDSEICSGLPIHLINLIQPYGVLVVVERETGLIVQVSENAEQIFGVPFQTLINTGIHTYLEQDSVKNLTESYAKNTRDKVPAVWVINKRHFLTLIHAQENCLLIEIDLDPYDERKQLTFVSVYQEIKYAMGLIQASKTIQEVSENCARELRRISGYDKVMVYCFDKFWNGTVIAEDGEESMESYLGITFPASDIPQQARSLYLKNPFRFIPEREFQPVKLFPVINPLTQGFLDLSDCNLRSIASVHLEYMKNMGVMSSMSARILNGESLWGLITCHHRTPRMLSFEMRSVFEMLSNIVSSRITSVQANELHLFTMKIKEQYKNLVEDTYREGNIHQRLLSGTPDLLSLFNVQGAAVCLGGKIYTKGLIPDDDKLRELLLWLHAKELKQVFYTDCLSFEYDQAQDFTDSASGLMVIPINHDTDEFLLMFRPEVVRTINWGGNPEQRIQFDEGSKNYHPRSSFEKWQQLVKGTSKPWRTEEVDAAENLRSFIYEFAN